MTRRITMEFDEIQWDVISQALYNEAGELAATEARKTAGRATVGTLGSIKSIHDIRDEIIDKVAEARKKPEIIR